MFTSPVAPVTPSKAPSHARRGDAVRRRLNYQTSRATTPTTTPTASPANLPLTESESQIGTFVSTPSRVGDTGVIMALISNEREVI